MPQVQIVENLQGPRPPEQPNRAQQNLQTFLSNIGNRYQENQDRTQINQLLQEYQQNDDEISAFRNFQVGLERSDISPSKRLGLQQRMNESEKLLIEQRKLLDKKRDQLSGDERSRQKMNLIQAGWPEYAAEHYLDSPPGVRQALEREHIELSARGLRKPVQMNQEQQPSIQQQPVQQQPIQQAPPQQNGAQQPIAQNPQAQNQPVQENKPSFPELPTPENMTHSERVKWQNSNEKENNKELKQTQTKKKNLQATKHLIRGMEKANESGKLPSGLASLIIDPATGEIRGEAQLAGLVNPETEKYVKNLKQFLRGAKEYFGARVTNFDVSSFMGQLPSLLNSEQGRRLILKEMEYVNDLENLHNGLLDDALKHYGRNANYSQIIQMVDDQIATKEKPLLDRIDNVVEAGSYLQKMSKNPEKFKNTILMMDPEGNFKAVPKDKVEALKQKAWIEY